MEAQGSTSTKSTEFSESSDNTQSSKFLSSGDEKYIEIPYEIVAGKRKNSKLLWSSSERQFFKRNCDTKIGAAYVCIEKSCNVRVYLKYDKCFKVNNLKEHNHGPNDDLEYRCRVMNEIKSKILSLSHNKMSNRDIYNEVMSRNQNSTLKFEEIERTLQNIRSSAMPPPPKNATEIATAFMREEIMTEYGKTKADVNIIDQMKDIPDKTFLMDATFKIVPFGEFKQLLIVYVEYLNKIFPFLLVLMSHKSEVAYTHVFRYINEEICPMNCKTFITDYEIAMKNALKKTFGSHIEYLSCWFHFTQAVRRKASQISGLYIICGDKPELKRLYYKFLCLPLLPVDEITTAYHALRAAASVYESTEFNKFMDYYNKQWILKEGPKSISVFNKETRTTCAVEAYNGKLGRKIMAHGNFFKFVEHIQAEELVKSIEFRQHIDSGGIESKRKDSATQRKERISKATKDLISKKLSVSDFLNRVSYQQNKIMPSSIEDSDDDAIMQANFIFDDEVDENELQLSTSHQVVTRDSTACMVCLDNRVNTYLEPCGHICVCFDCWNIIRSNFIEKFVKDLDLDYPEMERIARENPTVSELQIKEEWLPKCSNCRGAVSNAKKAFFPE